MKKIITGLVSVLALAMAVSSARADFVFTFAGLADHANNTAVQNYAQGVVSAAHPGGRLKSQLKRTSVSCS